MNNHRGDAAVTYPDVLDEWSTLQEVCAGRSLARYGDGEFALCAGHDLKCQVATPRLSALMRDILHESGDCLVGIPNLWADGPKAAYWRRRQTDARFLSSSRRYVSAFISRADSAPWIDTPEYWAALESLWVGQDVTLVRGANSERGLKAIDLVGARVREVLCPRINAFADYDAIREHIGTPKRVLLCLGPTATVLAVDLCARGVHAIDLGHVAFFLRKHRRGEPMMMTVEDKALV